MSGESRTSCPGAATMVDLARIRSRFLAFHVTADVGIAGGDDVEIIVGNKRGQVLGRLEYYPAWKIYVFAPAPGTVWSIECLADIGKALEILKQGKV